MYNLPVYGNIYLLPTLLYAFVEFSLFSLAVASTTCFFSSSVICTVHVYA